MRDDEFDATLVDIHGNEDDVSLTFPREDVSLQDLPLLQPGAVFYWVVGCQESAVGQRSRVAETKFRRLPVRRAKDWEQAAQQARKIRGELGL